MFNWLAANLSLCRDVIFKLRVRKCRAIRALALGKLILKLFIERSLVAVTWKTECKFYCLKEWDKGCTTLLNRLTDEKICLKLTKLSIAMTVELLLLLFFFKRSYLKMQFQQHITKSILECCSYITDWLALSGILFLCHTFKYKTFRSLLSAVL